MAERPAESPDKTTGPKTGAFSRRAVLMGTGVGAVSAAAMAAAGSPVAPTDRDEGPAPSGKGPAYRETDHIRAFYALSRF